jgi:hypothetical protein
MMQWQGVGPPVIPSFQQEQANLYMYVGNSPTTAIPTVGYQM